jgi:ABC-type glycerol-3-phosphate transport system substrate-binding protein
MKKFLIPALCLCAALGLVACSAPSETDDEEKGGIEQFTDEVARDATNTIKRPLDKARGVQDIAREHNKDIPQE